MRSPSKTLRRSLVTIAALAALLVAPRAATADDARAPFESLGRAARVECASTATSSNLSCQLVESIAACKRGDADACEVVGRVSMTRDVHDVPRATATPFFLLRACSLAPAKCVGLVPVAMRRLGDPDLALALLDEGCTRSVGVCRVAASMYVVGRAVPSDDAIAWSFTQRAAKAR